jgi:uncharacterized protein (DUF885 family)
VSRVYDIADAYVDEMARLDPVWATDNGVTGHDREMTDYSPDGDAARVALIRTTLEALGGAPRESDADRLAAEVMEDRLGAALASYDSGDHMRALRIIGSPVQSVRGVFDLMPHATPEDWEVVAERLSKVPDALSGFRATLEEGLARDQRAPRRQALECAKQAGVWSNGNESFFARYVAGGPDSLRERLDAGARAASDAYAGLERYLRQDYAPRADERDAAGPERYQVAAGVWLGMAIDPLETYRWGWSELHRIEAEMVKEADKISPGASPTEAIELLESDPARAIEGEENLRSWLQDLMDSTIAGLDGTHFDIADPIKRVEAMIAPPGGAAAMYYTGPSEDFSRPGRTWYPTLGKTRFPLWGEVSIAYHEGVPGHHLQVAQVMYLADRLSRFQRMTFVGGHGEGWALYAERLMDELGYLENPDYRLGQLRAQAMRAVRVIVDIGLHLSLLVPAEEDFHPGAAWTPDLAHEFAVAHSYFPSDFMASEIVRYLGWPAQAICYKVGERVWLEARDDVRRRQGPAFDLKAFHRAALDLGPMGLDQLRRELEAL